MRILLRICISFGREGGYERDLVLGGNIGRWSRLGVRGRLRNSRIVFKWCHEVFEVFGGRDFSEG